MFHSTLALFNRSFRVEARSWQAHFVRSLFALLILLSLAASHALSLVFSAPGQVMFTALSWLNFVFITLAGVGFFATAISEEKDEDALGLLKMAGVGLVSLLFGKSTARVVSLLLILAVQFPFVLLSITLGGVTLPQIIAATVALVAYLVFIANLGLACSVVATNSRNASRLTTLLVIGLLIGLPVVAMLLRHYAQSNAALGNALRAAVESAVAAGIEKLSIAEEISRTLRSGFNQGPFSPAAIAHLLGGIGLFGLAWWTFERFTQERHAMTRLEKAIGQPLRRGRRAGTLRAWRRALMWKDFEFTAGGKAFAIGRFVSYLGIIVAVTVFNVRTDLGPVRAPLRWGMIRSTFSHVAMASMLIMGVIELSLFASRVFREDVQARTLSLLLMLPISTRKLAWSKVSAILPMLIPAGLCFLLGVAASPQEVWDLAHHEYGDVATLTQIVWFAAFLHLTAYFSLVVKWGALPLALCLFTLVRMYVGTILYYLILSKVGYAYPSIDPGGRFAIFFAALELAVAAIWIAICQSLIRRRLEKLAGH